MFHFIPVQTNHNAEEHENKDSRRRARSHAIKQGILSKYKSQKTRLENFRHYKSLYSNSVPTVEPPSRVTLREDAIQITRFPGEMRWDPFDSLPVSSSRLQALLDLRKWLGSLACAQYANLLQLHPGKRSNLSSVWRDLHHFTIITRCFKWAWMI